MKKWPPRKTWQVRSPVVWSVQASAPASVVYGSLSRVSAVIGQVSRASERGWVSMAVWPARTGGRTAAAGSAGQTGSVPPPVRSSSGIPAVSRW